MEEEKMPSPLDTRKFHTCLLRTSAIVLIITGTLVFWCFINNNSNISTMQDFGSMGSYISGVAGTLFSLAGFFLLYLTLKDQRENFHKERLESNYFEMISFHRDNVNELQYTYWERPSDEKSVMAEKRKVFKIIFKQFKEAWQELAHFFESNNIQDIYTDEFLSKVKQNQTLIERRIDFKQYAQIDIIYTIVFFGLSREDRQTIKAIFKEKYRNTFIENIIDFAILKPKVESNEYNRWSWLNDYQNRLEIFNDIIKQRKDETYKSSLSVNWKIGDDIAVYEHFYKDNYEKYYGGHQFRLGHYYRHIFQTINFIDKEIYLSFEEKYNYIKILRGQLSNYEQIIFFLNSISQTGRSWEFEIKNESDKTAIENKRLITKYNLIKNIPIEMILDEIDVKNYYPNINFELITNQDILHKRKALIRQYY